MSFRDRMRGSESAGDFDMWKKCLDDKTMHTKPMYQKEVILWMTKTDMAWEHLRVAFYLDGEQVHKHEQHDREIDDKLVKLRWFVIRIRYRPPLSEIKKEKILEILRRLINWRISQKWEERRGGRFAQYGFDTECEKCPMEVEELVGTV